MLDSWWKCIVYVGLPDKNSRILVTPFAETNAIAFPLHCLHKCGNLILKIKPAFFVFSERELNFTFAICYRPSVCLSVVCLSVVCLSSVYRLSSVTFVRHTQAVQIFGNISTALGTLAILWHPLKIWRRSSPGNPSAGGVKLKRGSQVWRFRTYRRLYLGNGAR